MSDDAGLPGVTATATASTSLGSVETNSTTSEASSTMHQNPSSINDASTQQTNTSTPSLFQLCKNSVSDIVLPPGEEENRNKIEPLEQTSSPVLDLPSAAAIEDGITSSQECESAEVEDADRTEEIVDDEDPEEEDEIEEEDDDTESVVSHLISPALEQEREMRKAEDRKLLALLAHFDEEQLNRFEAFRRATFAKASVRRLMQSITSTAVSQSVVIAMAGLTKVYVGEIVERALDYKEKLGETGPLQPRHIREAFRQLNEENSSCTRPTPNPLF
ncbi:unnamed protein product [Dicrocoelium dendriticum]|nr:unnamed protein product [Dicrocoelium dendriticum]